MSTSSPGTPVTPRDVPAIINARMADMFGKTDDRCGMFLKCLDEADSTIDHPTLGEVKVCARHQIWYEELS